MDLDAPGSELTAPMPDFRFIALRRNDDRRYLVQPFVIWVNDLNAIELWINEILIINNERRPRLSQCMAEQVCGVKPTAVYRVRMVLK